LIRAVALVIVVIGVALSVEAREPPSPRTLASADRQVQQQISQSAYNDVRALMTGMEAARARRQALDDRSNAAYEALAGRENSRRTNVPTYEGDETSQSSPPNPCAGANVAAWRVCLEQIDGAVARLRAPEAERRLLLDQIEALRNGLGAAAGELSVVDMQTHLGQLNRIMQTLTTIRRRMNEGPRNTIQNTN